MFCGEGRKKRNVDMICTGGTMYRGNMRKENGNMYEGTKKKKRRGELNKRNKKVCLMLLYMSVYE